MHRDGLPLPGLTLPVVLSQLTYRVLGPERGRAKSVLDYLGLLGPADRVEVIAERHNVSRKSLRIRVVKVMAAGARLPLSSAILEEATRPLDLGIDDIKARRRQIEILGLPAVQPAHRLPRAPKGRTPKL